MAGEIRMTGLISGMDTDSIVQSLVSAHSMKVTKKKNDQKKLEWKQDKWKSLDSQVYSFFKGKLDAFTMSSVYNSKKASIADSGIASVKANSNAVGGAHKLVVTSLAQSSYLTGGKLDEATASDKKLSDLNISATDISITYKDKTYTASDLDITESTTLDQIASKISSKTGLNASFDAKNQRFYINGDTANFTISGGLADDLNINVADNGDGTYTSGGTYLKGTKAKITLDGADYEAETNTFEINGITVNATGQGSSVITIDKDVDAVYNSIVEFFDEYSKLINDMDKAYNADDAKKYSMLTQEQKDAMSDEEVEDWENKIKDSLLRRDENLRGLIDIFTSAMDYTYTDESTGKKYSLSNFGIGTLGYFLSGDNEKHAIHINGNEKDDNTKSEKDELRTAIINDPELVTKFFTGLAQNFSKKMNENMMSTDSRSKYKSYDDKALKKEYDNMTTDIKSLEDKLADIEDKYYQKFAAMETALAAMQDKQNAVQSLLNM